MSEIFFTSDLHFGHDRAFIYDPRGFKNVDEMNNSIITRFNKVITAEDDLYILGDVMLGAETNIKYLKQLNANLHIIIGNHDTSNRVELYRDCWNVKEIIGYAGIFKWEGYKFYISHYPTFTSNYDNEAPLKKHIINLYGHTHQTNNFYKDTPFMYHVGVDSHDCYPVEISQIINDINVEVKKCYAMV